MHAHDFILALVAFFSEFVGTLSGFGASMLFVPIAVHLENFQLVLALTAILHCFANVTKVLLFRRSFIWRSFLILAIPSLIFTAVGALLVGFFPTQALMRGLGVVLVLLSGSFLLGQTRIWRLPMWGAAVLTGFSGFTTGLFGTGGAIRGVALASLQLRHESFIMFSSGIDFGSDLVRLLIYLKSGFMDWTQWFYIPLLGLAAVFGARLGKRILARLGHERFEKTVAFFIFLSGLSMWVS